MSTHSSSGVTQHNVTQVTTDSGLNDCHKFNFIYTSDLDDVYFRIKCGTLEGLEVNAKVEDHLVTQHLYITCDLYSNGHLLCPTRQSQYKHMSNRFDWNEWLLFPLKLSDIPRDALLSFTIVDVSSDGKPYLLGGTAITIFGKHGAMRKGMYDLRVWLSNQTDLQNSHQLNGKQSISGQMNKINKLKKKYRCGELPRIDWLDRLTFLEIERLVQTEKKNTNYVYLSIEFPIVTVNGVDHSVVYFERGAEESCQYSFIENDLVIIPDPEMSMENLVENKHHKLSRSIRSGITDRDLKPNAGVRDQLNAIMCYSPTKVLSNEEQDLLWKFRFYLVNQKKALTKFLKSVNWHLNTEAHQAIELLENWQPIDIEDALELLSPHFQYPAVRRYAVTRLHQAPDEELLLYLLQLVQALKYENFDEIRQAYEKERRVDLFDDRTHERERRGSTTSTGTTGLTDSLNALKLEVHSNEANDNELNKKEENLATFLISRACTNDNLANYFFWYLMVECEDGQYTDTPPHTYVMTNNNNNTNELIRVSDMYVIMMRRFSLRLSKGSPEMRARRQLLQRQQTFVEKLVQLMKVVARENGNRQKKIDRLQNLLAEAEIFKINFTSYDPLPLPLDPEIKITGVIPLKATLFKSALMPGKLAFSTTKNTEYFTIFKHGDDLRQDQLILQMITLMDKLLRRENLDLKLTPYNVLATSSKHGFVQFIDSISVAEVLAAEGSIQNYFRKHAPSDAMYGISPEVMDAYVKSCAGYCVITYLLGVGDRHLDNLLLTRTGKLFHIDFGFILGRDPKPMPPPMKLSREMVDAMGGINSEHYQSFRKLCYTAFLHLRRHANLILNLFSLMIDASVPDIALEPDKTVKKVQDKFKFNLNDEEAVRYMQDLIDYSVKAFFPVMVEHIHKMAQFWRN
ncbi:phosphatidylinositol 3-kinase catalytic subunit type 3-like [Oppia nitens]|uniref:phosphatidylinositol 3-kinase catalytic subunit type 3-like n=1 Tax=Oppia nitens TaxID=1686743 RepID=UPI0023D9ACFA|nr:phosphatidylinositol 3-kinase catalytic subunit type 3-like [Oppia nitens]